MSSTQKDFFQETLELLQEYVDDRILLLKIQAVEKTGSIVSFLVRLLIISLLLFFVFLFGSLMLGLYFSDLFGSHLYGFGLITIIYLSLLIIYVSLNRFFKSKLIVNAVIKLFFSPSKVEQILEDETND